MSKKVNVVVVHGAWADGSSWGKVINVLNDAGYNVSATQHQLTSLQDDVEVTRRLAEMQDGATILVGHSYGGAVITEAAGKCPNVKGLVYLAAFAPDAGENLADLSQRAIPAPGNAAVHPDKYGMLWLGKEKFAESFCQDVDEEEAVVMAAIQKPIAIQSFSDKVTVAAWKNLPCWYQVSENDKMIGPEVETFMAERMEPQKTIYLPASHASMISHPKEVAELILEACSLLEKELSNAYVSEAHLS
jgi:pimeloyl-ACP methyl ester carboxylesterase